MYPEVDKMRPHFPPKCCHAIIMELGDETLDHEIESRAKKKKPYTY